MDETLPESAPGARHKARRRIRFSLLIVLGVALVGGTFAAHSFNKAQAELPPVKASGQSARPVSVAPVKRQDVPVDAEGLGTVQAFNTVVVKPRVGGRIDEIAFEEGQHVTRGTVLARIDAKPFLAALHQAQGTQEKDAAQLANSRLDLDRTTALAAKDIASKQTLDTQKAAVASLQAAVDTDKAAVEAAQVQLDYATVMSPIDGVAGARMVDVGNVIQPSDPGLVVLTQIQPIAVMFSLPEAKVASLPVGKPGRDIPVSALAPDGKVLATGQLTLIDNRIDTSTGMAHLKAVFDNADLALKPGQFVNARAKIDVLRGVLTIPDAAVQHDQAGTYVFTVGNDGRAHKRTVKIDTNASDTAVVANGLSEDDTVVLDGDYGLSDGQRVAVRAAPPAGQHRVATIPGMP